MNIVHPDNELDEDFAKLCEEIKSARAARKDAQTETTRSGRNSENSKHSGEMSFITLLSLPW